jgi:leucyl aminopeptidase
MPGGRAMKPGDIVKTLSGKTVEVQNTDAEGRLILADALAYAQRYNPAALVDIATLTGACVVALGQFAIGMFGTDDKLKAQVEKSGRRPANECGRCLCGTSISSNYAATLPTCATSADVAAE